MHKYDLKENNKGILLPTTHYQKDLTIQQRKQYISMNPKTKVKISN